MKKTLQIDVLFFWELASFFLGVRGVHKFSGGVGETPIRCSRSMIQKKGEKCPDLLLYIQILSMTQYINLIADNSSIKTYKRKEKPSPLTFWCHFRNFSIFQIFNFSFLTWNNIFSIKRRAEPKDGGRGENFSMYLAESIFNHSIFDTMKCWL